MIVKVQWPQAPADAPIFIYSKPGPAQLHWMVEQSAITPSLLQRIRDDCKATGKAYYDASMFKTSKVGMPQLGKRVEDQNW